MLLAHWNRLESLLVSPLTEVVSLPPLAPHPPYKNLLRATGPKEFFFYGRGLMKDNVLYSSQNDNVLLSSHWNRTWNLSPPSALRMKTRDETGLGQGNLTKICFFENNSKKQRFPRISRSTLYSQRLHCSVLILISYRSGVTHHSLASTFTPDELITGCWT